MTTPAGFLDRELRRDGARPFITAYDEAGGRVELSIATTANWVAKTAGYLEDEIGLGPADHFTVEPTLHWLTAVVMLAGWAIGAELDAGGTAAERVDVPLDPMGIEFNRMVAPYPDRYVPASPTEAAATITELPQGARVLTTLPLDDRGVDLGLLAPLAAGGSVVYAPTTADLASLAGAERVTHTAGADVSGLPRLGS